MFQTRNWWKKYWLHVLNEDELLDTVMTPWYATYIYRPFAIFSKNNPLLRSSVSNRGPYYFILKKMSDFLFSFVLDANFDPYYLAHSLTNSFESFRLIHVTCRAILMLLTICFYIWKFYVKFNIKLYRI